MMIKKCDVTSNEMDERHLDYGEAPNLLKLPTGSLNLLVTIRRASQFGGEIHVSKEGMEKLLLEAAANLPIERPATVVPESEEKEDDGDGKKKASPVLNRK